MSDPRLAAAPFKDQRREQEFRQACTQLQAACGELTIAGNSRFLDAAASPPDGTAAEEPTIVTTPQGLSHPCSLYLTDDRQQVYPLHFGINTIGRMVDNDVVLTDDCVSRRHCAIVVHHDLRCELHDVASKNGTLLNGQRLTAPSPLQPGDRIDICNHLFILHHLPCPGDAQSDVTTAQPS